jgi:heptaprenyl diphosphate synthase
MWKNYPQLAEELEIVRNKIVEVNRSSARFLNESVEYLALTGGKMLRPAFTMIGFGFGKVSEKEKVYTMATAIETLHMATLIHDDIIDDSDLRRGMPTIQAKYKKDYAVYMGDYLFTQCFLMLSQHDYSQENLMNVSKGISKICIGDMRQNRNRYNSEVTTGEYIRIISGKTAGLFGLSLSIGGHLGQVDTSLEKKLFKIGYSIGMAFQIKDDLLDYQGEESVVGKDLAMDLYNGYYTLPVIFALKKNKEILEPYLDNKVRLKTEIKDVLEIIKSTGSLKKTKALAEKYTKRSLSLIESLPECDSKYILKNLVPLLLEREK